MITETERDVALRKLRHDILNSLNVISMCAQALETDPSDTELIKEVCENIERERKVVGQLVGELFDVACQSQ